MGAKIKFDMGSPTTIEYVTSGDTFLYNNAVYMVAIVNDEDYECWNLISLYDGNRFDCPTTQEEIINFVNQNKMIPVNLEITVKKF